jgi:hypothetical protein
MDIARRVQIALLGEIPPTLRFVYAWMEADTLHLQACFTDGATEDDLECARVAFTEVISGYPVGTEVVEEIRRDSRRNWKRFEGMHLMFLRHGEQSDT